MRVLADSVQWVLAAQFWTLVFAQLFLCLT